MHQQLELWRLDDQLVEQLFHFSTFWSDCDVSSRSKSRPLQVGWPNDQKLNRNRRLGLNWKAVGWWLAQTCHNLTTINQNHGFNFERSLVRISCGILSSVCLSVCPAQGNFRSRTHSDAWLSLVKSRTRSISLVVSLQNGLLRQKRDNRLGVKGQPWSQLLRPSHWNDFPFFKKKKFTCYSKKIK